MERRARPHTAAIACCRCAAASARKIVINRTPSVHSLPAIRTTISSRCQQLLGRGRYRRNRRAIIGPNFNTQLGTLSYETSRPHSARRSSTSRQLGVSRRYSQTACWITTAGNRCQRKEIGAQPAAHHPERPTSHAVILAMRSALDRRSCPTLAVGVTPLADQRCTVTCSL